MTFGDAHGTEEDRKRNRKDSIFGGKIRVLSSQEEGMSNLVGEGLPSKYKAPDLTQYTHIHTPYTIYLGIFHELFHLSFITVSENIRMYFNCYYLMN